ncbi:MAG TPA: hypothetical protein PK771_15500, partial [Spirochaetota bacterium]|nr:hypothetical protein [Spirochaetota bacterium]
MKFFLVLFVVLLGIQFSVFAQDYPAKYAKKVADVYEGYAPDKSTGWIVTDKEEKKGDHNVSNAPECDIRAIMSCYDDSKLRVDLVLWNPISYKWLTYFAINMQYAGGVEEFYYYDVDSKELRYRKTDNGSVVKDEVLTQDDGTDFAFITTYDGKADMIVGLIIDKDKHFG